MAREYQLPSGARLTGGTTTVRALELPTLPPLPTFRCRTCGVEHLTNPAPTGWPGTVERRCLYCGRPHRLVGGRWERA